MVQSPAETPTPWSHRICGWLGVFLVFAGLMVLVGWTYEIRFLMSILPESVVMKPNTATGFVLTGSGLWLSRPGQDIKRRSWLAKFVALLLGVLGVLTLVEYGFHLNLGIDEAVFTDKYGKTSAPPGRMAPITAMNFVLFAAALLLIDVTTRTGKRPSHWLVLVIATNAYLAALGYIFNVYGLYAVVDRSPVAIHTAILSLLACLAVVFARPENRFIRQIFADNMASQVNRRVMPVAILLPPLMGWLSLEGQMTGFFTQQFGMAIFTIGNVVILTALSWRSASALQQIHDRQMAVSEVNEWQRAILDSADFSVIATDVHGTIQTVNYGAEIKLGYAPGELIGKTPELIHDPEEVAARAITLSQELGRDIQPGFEVLVMKPKLGLSEENDWTYICKDGRRFPVRLSVTALHNSAGHLTGYLGIGSDVTERKQAEAKVLYLARFDGLTGLVNRSYFLEKLAEAIARSERSGDPLALIFLDLDHFKRINDTYGHHRGDLVLKGFADRLSQSVRSTDTVARLAGDEFVILLDLSQDANGATRVADKIVACMQRPFELAEGKYWASTSMGIAVRRPGETDPDAFLRRADAALYRAKSAGRGGYIIER